MTKRIYFAADGVTVANIGPEHVPDLPEGVVMVTEGTIVVEDDVEVGIGYAYDGEAFHAPAPVAPTVPQVTSPRQLKLALLGAGLLDSIDAFVSHADRAVQISWEYATEFRRDHPLLAQMAQAFGMADEKVDELFIAAAQIA